MINMTFNIKPLHILGIIVILAVISIVIYMATTSNPAPVVAAGDTIKVFYTGTLANGTVFDSNVGGDTLNFTVGSGQLIKGFDQGVVGMKLNETKTILIPANDAYGPVNPALIASFPISSFGNMSVKEGLQVTSSANGEEVHGIVTQVNATNATVDFNSPLAGKNLTFKITVVAIQKA